MDPPLVIPFSVRQRVDLYRTTLRSKIQILGDVGGAGTEPEQFAVKTYCDTLEGVDEDAGGTDVKVLTSIREQTPKRKYPPHVFEILKCLSAGFERLVGDQGGVPFALPTTLHSFELDRCLAHVNTCYFFLLAELV